MDNSIFVKYMVCTEICDLDYGLYKVYKMIRAFVQGSTVSLKPLEIQEKVTLCLNNRGFGKLSPMKTADITGYCYLLMSVEFQEPSEEISTAIGKDRHFSHRKFPVEGSNNIKL